MSLSVWLQNSSRQMVHNISDVCGAGIRDPSKSPLYPGLICIWSHLLFYHRCENIIISINLNRVHYTIYIIISIIPFGTKLFVKYCEYSLYFGCFLALSVHFLFWTLVFLPSSFPIPKQCITFLILYLFDMH